MMENAGTSVDAARAVKGKLMSTTTIFDNLAVKGYDPKKIPAGWLGPIKIVCHLRRLYSRSPRLQSPQLRLRLLLLRLKGLTRSL